ncbi:hypothetical protein G2W53_011060 [Senna tora]|uniref:Uncharacterized protein n=1 Tax=Senna tora TaxID=362788 RepID=A0A835CA70_9FABA|nr:hypothetical protein G2W53_011060 [Senna tora]
MSAPSISTTTTNHRRPHFHTSSPPLSYPPQQFQLRVHSDRDDRPTAAGARSLGPAAAPAADDRVLVIVPIFFTTTITPFFIIVREVTIEIRSGGVGGGVNKSEHGIVLPQSLHRVPDGGHVATPRARQRRIRRRGEHPRETLSTESMPALEQKWDSVFLVVPRLANRTAGDFHIIIIILLLSSPSAPNPEKKNQTKPPNRVKPQILLDRNSSSKDLLYAQLKLTRGGNDLQIFNIKMMY